MIEIEKKYRVSKALFDSITTKYLEYLTVFATEENILFSGDGEYNRIYRNDNVYRLRSIEYHEQSVNHEEGETEQVFTFKKSISDKSGLKKKREIEFEVDISGMEEFLVEGLDLHPYLLYQKRRMVFHIDDCLLCLDELPFGYFIEIEGDEDNIEKLEQKLVLTDFIESRSYPQLTVELGVKSEGMYQAKFTRYSPE